MSAILAHVMVALCGAASSSCQKCEVDGCEAFERPAATEMREGLAGVVALQSDLVRNGCQECGVGQATLLVWSTGELVRERGPAEAMADFEPDYEIRADARYEQEIAAGNYLLCVLTAETTRPCAAFEIAQGKVTTINLKQRAEGPTSLLVFDAGSATPRGDETFDFAAPP